MGLEPLQNIAVSVIQDGATFTATITWSAIRTYDKIVVAWGVGNTLDAPAPSSADIDGNAKSYVVQGLLPNTSYVFKVEGGTRVDIGVTVDWQYSGFIATVVATPQIPPFGPNPQLLFYSSTRPKTNNAFLASFGPKNGSSSFDIAPPAQVGGWEQDWTTLTPLKLSSGDLRLLFYRQKDGDAFVAPVAPNAGSLHVGNLTLVHAWENDWTQITTFELLGTLHLLFYRRDGNAFAATVAANGDGLSVGQPARIGGWETDWTQIKGLTLNNEPYLLLYRKTNPDRSGYGFLAHVVARATGIDIEKPIAIPLPGNLSQVTPFTSGGAQYLLLYQSDGKPFVAGLSGSTTPVMSAPKQISNGWENDWAQIAYLQR